MDITYRSFPSRSSLTADSALLVVPIDVSEKRLVLQTEPDPEGHDDLRAEPGSVSSSHPFTHIWEFAVF